MAQAYWEKKYYGDVYPAFENESKTLIKMLMCFTLKHIVCEKT